MGDRGVSEKVKKFRKFKKKFAPLPESEVSGVMWTHPLLVNSSGYSEFASVFAGTSFGGGLYRFHHENSGVNASNWLDEAFPEFRGALAPFGFDWLGRQFALDPSRVIAGEAQVMMLEPGTGYALEILASFSDFHDDVLVNQSDAALASSFFDEWQSVRNVIDSPLAFTECVGYRVPLFLGGVDSVENVEVVDMDVYWALSAQLIQTTQDLPDGTPMSGVEV